MPFVQRFPILLSKTTKETQTFPLSYSVMNVTWDLIAYIDNDNKNCKAATKIRDELQSAKY